jgi:hypothetical protein
MANSIPNSHSELLHCPSTLSKIKGWDLEKYKYYQQNTILSEEMAGLLARYKITPEGPCYPYAELFDRTLDCSSAETDLNLLAKVICVDLTGCYRKFFKNTAREAVKNKGEGNISKNKVPKYKFERKTIAEFSPEFMACIVSKLQEGSITPKITEKLIEWKLTNPKKRVSVDSVLTDNCWYPKTCKEVRNAVEKIFTNYEEKGFSTGIFAYTFLDESKLDTLSVFDKLFHLSMRELKGWATRDCVIDVLEEVIDMRKKQKEYAADILQEVLADYDLMRDRFYFNPEDLLKSRIESMRRSGNELKQILD